MGCSSSRNGSQGELTLQPPTSTSAGNSKDAPPVAPGIVCGYLRKEGAIYTTMRKRFFVLNEGKLTWYGKQAAPYSLIGVDEKGSLALNNYKVMHKITKTKFTTQIVLTAPSPDQRSLLIEFLDPSNENITNQWITSLNAHIQYLNELETYTNKSKQPLNGTNKSSK